MPSTVDHLSSCRTIQHPCLGYQSNAHSINSSSGMRRDHGTVRLSARLRRQHDPPLSSPLSVPLHKTNRETWTGRTRDCRAKSKAGYDGGGLAHIILRFWTQQMEGAKKRIFGVFEGFFDLYTPQKRRKHDTSLDFAAFLRQRKNGRKRCRKRCRKGQILTKKLAQKRRKLRCRKNAAKFNEVSCLRRFCGAYKWQKMKKSQNPFTMSLGYVQHVGKI